MRRHRPKIDPATVEAEVARIRSLDKDELRDLWRATFNAPPVPALTKDLIGRILAYRIQEQAFGGLDRESTKLLDRLARGGDPNAPRPRRLKPGTVIVREYQGQRHTVTVASDGYIWGETTYASLSTIARAITGTNWNGPRFFGLRMIVNEDTEAKRDSDLRRARLILPHRGTTQIRKRAAAAP